jgi:enoyl-CoA hydratase
MQIAQNAPLSVAEAKITVTELIKNLDEWEMAVCDSAIEACYHSNDYVEGQKAFGNNVR